MTLSPEKLIEEKEVQEAAKILCTLVDKKRVLTAQYAWHRDASIKNDIQEELDVVATELDVKYKLIMDYYKQRGLK